jgi:ABC-type nitrate/sulfonate/bicarbonate transport system ATPase subunit
MLPDSPPALVLDNIRKTYLSRKGVAVDAIAGVSLSVRQNEVVALVGPSGCGKSTLLRLLGGLDADYDGTIEWSLPLEGAAGSRLRSATVFQSDSTFPWMTVADNLVVGLSGLTLTRAQIADRISRYLALVGLAEFRNAFPHELSGGMRQRVAIARALATEPLFLLMDEPLAALDAQTRLVMQQELLRIWQKTSLTVIYITHDIAEALSLAHRVVVLSARPGRIKAVFDTPFGDERELRDLRRRPEFGALEMEIWQSVAEEVGQSLDAAPARKEDGQ